MASSTIERRTGARSRFRLHLAIPLLLLTTFVFACSTNSPVNTVTSDDWSTQEALIISNLQASADAWNRGDLKGHLSDYADSVTFMTSQGPRVGVAPIEEAFTRVYFKDGRPKQELRFEQVVVRPLGRDAALQTGRFVLSGGNEPEQSGWFTVVLMRTPQGWEIVHDHSS